MPDGLPLPPWVLVVLYLRLQVSRGPVGLSPRVGDLAFRQARTRTGPKVANRLPAFAAPRLSLAVALSASRLTWSRRSLPRTAWMSFPPHGPWGFVRCCVFRQDDLGFLGSGGSGGFALRTVFLCPGAQALCPPQDGVWVFRVFRGPFFVPASLRFPLPALQFGVARPAVELSRKYAGLSLRTPWPLTCTYATRMSG